jgi:hypothetical protein
VAEPAVVAPGPADACLAVAHYITEIVRRRLQHPTALEIRTFERLHPSKVRMIHELDTRVLNDYRQPLR